MRLNDWPQRLSATLTAARTRAYVFGEHDCGLNAADAALAVTGEDPAAAYRGRYTTYAGARRLLRRIDGVKDLIGWADKLWPRTTLARARRGDWAWGSYPGEDGQPVEGLLVVDGADLAGAEGRRTRLAAGVIFWAVG
jgi:hypothetical protein